MSRNYLKCILCMMVIGMGITSFAAGIDWGSPQATGDKADKNSGSTELGFGRNYKGDNIVVEFHQASGSSKDYYYQVGKADSLKKQLTVYLLESDSFSALL